MLSVVMDRCASSPFLSPLFLDLYRLVADAMRVVYQDQRSLIDQARDAVGLGSNKN